MPVSAPKWPDFEVKLIPFRSHRIWIARTDTGRPRTPIFTIGLTNCKHDLPEESVREYARVRLDYEYEKAHPNGCPRAERGVLETQPHEATERVSNPSPRLAGSRSES